MYARKPTSESLNPAASLTNVPLRIAPSGLSGPTIHEPLRPAKDAAIHTSIHGDSKSLPNNRTAKVRTFFRSHLFYIFDRRMFYDYLTEISIRLEAFAHLLDFISHEYTS